MLDSPRSIPLRLNGDHQGELALFLVEGYAYPLKHATPALEDLFDEDESPKLVEMKRLHTYVAKLLYLAKQTRPECLVATLFLCTRVTSTMQDQKKLDRAIGHLRGTPNRTVTLRPGKMGIVPRLYVDASCPRNQSSPRSTLP